MQFSRRGDNVQLVCYDNFMPQPIPDEIYRAYLLASHIDENIGNFYKAYSNMSNDMYKKLIDMMIILQFRPKMAGEYVNNTNNECASIQDIVDIMRIYRKDITINQFKLTLSNILVNSNKMIIRINSVLNSILSFSKNLEKIRLLNVNRKSSQDKDDLNYVLWNRSIVYSNIFAMCDTRIVPINESTYKDARGLLISIVKSLYTNIDFDKYPKFSEDSLSLRESWDNIKTEIHDKGAFTHCIDKLVKECDVITLFYKEVYVDNLLKKEVKQNESI